MNRRDFVAGTGALATLLAGCSGRNAGDDAENGSGGNGTDAGTGTAESGGSYSVTMAPVGEVTFDSVPETWSTYFPGYADMGVALGMADGLRAVGNLERYYTTYYGELEGVSVDKSSLTQLYGDGGIDKEIYYQIGADVHLTDPNWLSNNSSLGLEEKDVEMIGSSVAPFVGNTVFRRTDKWHNYPYYTLYGAFEKVAKVFQRTDRYDAFSTLHDSFVGDVQGKLPVPEDRPAGMLLFAATDEPEAFSPYRIAGQGTNKKHFHDLGVTDALAGTGIEGLSTNDRGKVDYETILQVDPEAIFVRGHETKSRSEFERTVLSFMENHPVASDLTAVQNGDVYRGGPIYQGPIQNLFITERFARLLYPAAFGDEKLFDRSRVSNIVNGNL